MMLCCLSITLRATLHQLPVALTILLHQLPAALAAGSVKCFFELALAKPLLLAKAIACDDCLDPSVKTDGN
ncbi:hypothetical protein D0T50_12535 [Bacteroides sp. 214]|nr:hypothetical protein [Bacteroides sp. 214]